MISVDTGHGAYSFVESDDKYPFYLFIMLWYRSHPEYSDLEHDVAYRMILDAWSSFVSSDHDDVSVDLYTRISNYLSGEKSSIQLTGNAKEASSRSDSKDRTSQTRVFYRRIVDNPQAGDIIAVFPDDIFDFHGNISSYMHTGQHSGCSTKFLSEETVASNTGCDAHGCMNVELYNQGYNNLKTVTIHEMNGSTKAKCLYCNSGAEPTHFICEDCGDGMCDECYYEGIEHDRHYQDPAESAETEEERLIIEDVFGNGYACECCVKKVTRMIKNMREEND